MEKARFKLRINGHGNQLSGTLLDELRDPEGNVIFLGPGTFTASRIQVEPQE
jgi:hypothetical protein